MSEHDWQATVLAELGIPRSGLVTPDSSGQAPAHAAPASSSAAQSWEGSSARDGQPPAPNGSASDWTAQPVVAAPQAPQEEYDPRPEPWPDQPRAAPSTGGHTQPQSGWPAEAGTPSGQVHSPPEPPAYQPTTHDPPAQQPPPPAPQTWWPQQDAPADQPPRPAQSPWQTQVDRPSAPRESEPESQTPAAQPPAEQAGWDQASWDAAVQAPWGAPGQDRDAAAQAQPEAWDQSGADAWQRDAEPPPPAVPNTAWPPAQPQPGGGGQVSAHDLIRRSAHGDPLVRRMSRGVRRAVGAAAADEVRKTADVESVLGRPVPSCRQIAVTSIRGGAGKTTVAGLTATVIAQYRQDRVLAVDADSGLGSLPLRLGIGTDRSLHDLATSHPRSFDEASRYLARTADGLWVLSGTAGGRIAGELDLATFKSAAGGMSRYFATTVIDCGAGLLPELQRGILADAHAQVMVTPGTVDGALSARGALEWQARSGYEHLLTRTVVAFVTHTPHVDADLTRAAQMLSSGGLPVVHMPYDRHLAAGTAIESARIGQETRAAAIRVAVEVFARATSI